MKPNEPIRSVAAMVLWIALLVSVAILVFVFVLPKRDCHEENLRSCGPYLTTPGYTIPHWDIVIVEGNSLEIFCILNLNHTLGQDHNATDLRFYRNGTLIEPQYLTVVNETTLRFYEEKPAPTKFSVICNLKPRTEDTEIFVCLNIVNVKPDQTLYDILRMVLAVILLIGVGILGSWYAGRLYRNYRELDREKVKTQAETLPAEETKDPSFQKIISDVPPGDGD